MFGVSRYRTFLGACLALGALTLCLGVMIFPQLFVPLAHAAARAHMAGVPLHHLVAFAGLSVFCMAIAGAAAPAKGPNANINAGVIQFLAWASSEGKQAAKDEGQIIDTFATKLSEGVQAGKSWADAFNEAKTELVVDELNEWQKLQLDSIEELAAVIDQANTILQGMASLLP